MDKARGESVAQVMKAKRFNFGFLETGRESELLIVPFGSQSSITLGEGRGNAFIEFLKEGRTGDGEMLKTPEMSGNFRGDYTRRPSRLRKPLEEDDRKAVCGKTA